MPQRSLDRLTVPKLVPMQLIVEVQYEMRFYRRSTPLCRPLQDVYTRTLTHTTSTASPCAAIMRRISLPTISASICGISRLLISLSVSSLLEYHFETSTTYTDIVDIKPENMEELTEVITAAEYHPEHCNLFVYSSSKGTIRMCDQRQQSLCDKPTLGESPNDLLLDALKHMLQFSRSQKIRSRAPSSAKSSPQSVTSNSRTGATIY